MPRHRRLTCRSILAGTEAALHINQLEGGRPDCAIGHIRATSGWRPASDPVGEADRLEAIEALVREAQENDADAIVGLDFEVASVKRDEIDGIHIWRRPTAPAVEADASFLSAFDC
jgi:hypothetical protein